MIDYDPLFRPKTMAVVGVSLSNDRHPANVVFAKNHFRYPVTVYPVNPRGGVLQGERVFRSVSEIGDTIDVAVIAVRADIVPKVIQECIEAGVRSAIVVSGGFAEIGQKELQDRVTAAAREASFPFLGPNCLGIFAPGRVDTLFLPSERLVCPSPGGVALVSQSGGFLVDQMLKFSEEGVGMSLGVSIGNKALIRENELLAYFSQDTETRVIAFYIEGFADGDGRKFALAARECPKAIVALKAGRSKAGAHAVSSHTASLAGDYEVFASVLTQCGVTVAENELEFVSRCESLGAYSVKTQGRIGIVTGSGGHGALAVDACAEAGLSVPTLSAPLQKELRNGLSASVQPIASVTNPVDLTGSAVDDDFVKATDFLAEVSEIDCILVLLLPYLPGISSDLGARLSTVCRRKGRPLVAYVPHVEKYGMFVEGFEFNGVPVAPSIDGAVQMAQALAPAYCRASQR